MSAYDTTDGIGGLWEVHQWNGGVELNTQDGPGRFYVARITGLHSLPERNDPRSPRVARIGENRRKRGVLGKTITYEGTMMANTVPDLRSMRTGLISGFSGTDVGYMDIIPQLADGSPTARFYADVLQLDPPEEIKGSRPYDRDFLLGLRLSDPRFYFPSLAVSVSGNPASVTNVGNAPADPIITVAGASGAVTVSDGTHTLTFRNVPSGSLVIDFGARTAKVGATDCDLVVASSDWWDRFVEGVAGGATVSVAQTGGSGVTVAFTPADWA